MTDVPTAAYWRVFQEMLELAGDLHAEGHLDKEGFDRFAAGLTKASYEAGVQYLRDAEIIPA